MKSTTLIVSDVEFSALSIAGRSRANMPGTEIIYAFNYKTPKLLLRDLIARKPQVILFTWRQALIDLLNVCPNKDLMALRTSSILTVLIPDHLGISTKFQSQENALLNYVDYYLVTSKLLLDIYTNSPNVPAPAGILHDIPDVDLIRKVRSEERVSEYSKAIWIGNSKWGINQGFIDHKGFYSVIKPLTKLFNSHDKCIKLEVIDSSNFRKSNIEVLRAIASSKFLLQSSMSEGTGLPILEALGLGVTPITTDVGIAHEVIGNYKELIVPRDHKVFHHHIHQELLEPSLSKEEAIKVFESYIRLISSEQILRDHERNIARIEWLQPKPLAALKVISKWILRHHMNTRKNIRGLSGQR